MDFIDLKSQQARIKSRIDTNIAKVLEHGQYIMGPEVKAFEEQLAQYTGAKHAIGVASGTDALLIAMMALDIGQGEGFPVYRMLRFVLVLVQVKFSSSLLEGAYEPC